MPKPLLRVMAPLERDCSEVLAGGVLDFGLGLLVLQAFEFIAADHGLLLWLWIAREVYSAVCLAAGVLCLVLCRRQPKRKSGVFPWTQLVFRIQRFVNIELSHVGSTEVPTISSLRWYCCRANRANSLGAILLGLWRWIRTLRGPVLFRLPVLPLRRYIHCVVWLLRGDDCFFPSFPIRSLQGSSAAAAFARLFLTATEHP
mmetsp:Transcript_38241/g.108098  ORF Transcript_38241/g.108098 Transcript_38241/m.108098 type:complete len:201 (-) Transcript_38241:36-638(-)